MPTPLSSARRPGVGMASIDQDGNLHDAAGRFAGHVNTRPAASLASRTQQAGAPAYRTRAGKRTELATGATNEFVADFDFMHPDPSLDDYRLFLLDPPVESHPDPYREGEPFYDGDERREAVQAISARLAAGQAGILTEAGALHPGDRIDLSRLWVTPDYDTVRAEWAASNYAIIGDIPMETGDGDTIFRLSNSPHPVVVPSGTMFPVQAVTFRGEQVTERDAVRTLIREGLIAEDRREHYADALVDYAATHGIFPSHPDYPEPVI